MTSDKYCEGCIYHGYAGGDWRCCDYIFIEDKRRPCPPGKDCTVKTVKVKVQKKKVHGTKKICEWCGVEFVLNNNSKQKYCCNKCRFKAYEKKRSEAKI